MKHLVKISMIFENDEKFSIEQVMSYQKIGSWIVNFYEEGALDIKVEILKYNMTEQEIKEHEKNIKNELR